MFAHRRGISIVAILFWVMVSHSSWAQPTLPDLTGINENGFALLSWTCQYDGVKSISVLRSTDSNFNYSTIGYVKNLYKGVQAFVDGHPTPGKNFYKLFIVFNSGLTWRSNHYGVFVDSASINPRRIAPSNEALQKLIVNETLEKVAKADAGKPRKPMAAAEKERYTEVIKKDKYADAIKKEMDVLNDTSIKRPKFKFNANDSGEIDQVLANVPLETRKKLTITYDNDTNEIDAGAYIEDKSSTPELKKKIHITFDDNEDVSTFIETLPEAKDRKITLSYSEDTDDVDAADYVEEEESAPAKTQLNKIQAQQPKKISVTFKDDRAAQAYIAAMPKTQHSKITVSYNIDSAAPPKAKPVAEAPAKPVDVPKPKISIKFHDDFNNNPVADIKSKYVAVDPTLGHVKINLPDDVATHHYSVKFFDKENRIVIEVPKLNSTHIIMDKRNFQKKGQYKFTIRKDAIELESGNITIY